MSEKPNLQLINTNYLSQRKGFDDKLMVTYKDMDTNEKHIVVVDDPKITWYLNKKDHWLTQPVSVIENDKVVEMTSLARNLFKDMADALGKEGKEFYSSILKNREFGRRKELHYNPNFHGTDVNVEDQYISKFVRKFGQPENPKLSKSYFDIEVDITPSSGWDDGFPDEFEAKAPINAITLYLDEENICYTYLLRKPGAEQYIALEENVEKVAKDVNSYFKDFAETDKKFKELLGDFNPEYIFKFFDDEIYLIQDFFNDVHTYKPDFLGAYNMKFDFVTLMNRITNLGYRPEDFFCHEDFPYQYLFYWHDDRTEKFSDKGDYAKVSSYTNYIDLMLAYASIRKGRGEEESLKLNDIAFKNLGLGKYEMGEDVTIANIPDIDYHAFVVYNIIDVLLLKFLEDKNNDIGLLYKLSMLTESRLNKALKKSISLRNYVSLFYDKQGLKISNNRNTSYGLVKIEDNGEKFKGGFVANPRLNRGGVDIDNVPSRYLFEMIIDFDYSSLYPNTAIGFNIDTTMQIGRINIEGFNGDDFIGHIVSHDMVNVGHEYFNLNKPSKIISKMKHGKYDDILSKYGYDRAKILA